jgi:hypothetical protein
LCYLALVLTFILCLLCRDSIFSVWHIMGSTKLHNDLFSRVLQVLAWGMAGDLCDYSGLLLLCILPVFWRATKLDSEKVSC